MKELFKIAHSHNKLNPCWIIATDNNLAALAQLENFIKLNLLTEDVSLANNPDLLIIQNNIKDLETNQVSSNIVIDQIRKLKQFMLTTAMLSKNKIGIIIGADQMNVNAANCCLKILEEPANNKYLFLITEKPHSLLVTIRSRCAKLTLLTQYPNNLSTDYLSFIETLSKNSSINEKLKLIEAISKKNHNEWKNFASCALSLINRLTKFNIGEPVELLPNEIALSQNKMVDFDSLQQKFANIQQIINNTMAYQLDLKANSFLLINQLNQLN